MRALMNLTFNKNNNKKKWTKQASSFVTYDRRYLQHFFINLVFLLKFYDKKIIDRFELIIHN